MPDIRDRCDAISIYLFIYLYIYVCNLSILLSAYLYINISIPQYLYICIHLPVATKEEVAKYTVQVMKRTIPPAVPGIHFLSGGMGEEESTLNLLQLQKEYPNSPWALTFSYGRALQSTTLKTWRGKPENVEAAQEILVKLAKANSEAQLGILDYIFIPFIHLSISL